MTQKSAPASALGLFFLAALCAVGDSASKNNKTNFNTMKVTKMIKIESAIDTVATLDLLSKLAAFIKANCADPSKFKMDTGLRGEIQLRVGDRKLVKAQRDFFNDSSWNVEVVEELRNAIQPAKMF